VIASAVRWLCRSALASLCFAAPAFSAATDPVQVELPSDALGAAFATGIRRVVDLPQPLIEEEFLVGGTATLFSYASSPPQGPGDIVPVQSGVPWKTRLIVRRPADPRRFNGSLVIEWWNSTAGFDSAPSWDVSAEYFAREGFVYVGVTNSTTAIAFLRGGCRLFGIFPPSCGTRYASLSLPDNGLAYEAISQIAYLLKSGGAGSPLPADYRVKRLYHVGQSQQGGSVITYASAFHVPGVNDGYFVQANIFARAIKDGAACGASGAPAFPACVPRLQGSDVFVRSDLPVPVVQALTETDVDFLFGTSGRQPDAPNYRYYEMAGTAHLTVHENVEVIPAGVLGPDALLLEDVCLNPVNSGADGPVHASYLYNAMWRNLEQQVRRGLAPPAGRVIRTDAAGEILRDAYGNARGGLGLPAIQVPIASYNPPSNVADPTLPPALLPLLNLACRLGGSYTPFDMATLHRLYGSQERYEGAVALASFALFLERFLLPEDWKKIARDAAEPPILPAGCDLGGEAALVLPVLLWLGRRRYA
jgi:hypothetical protein